MRNILAKSLVGLALAFACAFGAAGQETFETKALHAIMIDGETGSILYEKAADAAVPPASLAKLMTMEIVFNALKAKQLTLDQPFAVSAKAAALAGQDVPVMPLKARSSVRLEDLIRGVVVHAANDACVVIAESMAGTEEAFAALMTARAREIGLSRSTFVNATGLPAAGQSVTMREIAALGRHIWREYPNHYAYYAEKEFVWNNTKLGNRNPLLRMNIGADGMQTGFTDESRYAILGAAAQGTRRLFVALTGIESERERADEARRMIDWGMKDFERRELFARDAVVGEALVYGGIKAGVRLAAAGPVAVVAPIARRDSVRAEIVYVGPVAAPIEKGRPIGALKIRIGETLSTETPLFAAEDVPLAPLHWRAFDAIEELLTGWLR